MMFQSLPPADAEESSRRGGGGVEPTAIAAGRSKARHRRCGHRGGTMMVQSLPPAEAEESSRRGGVEVAPRPMDRFCYSPREARGSRDPQTAADESGAARMRAAVPGDGSLLPEAGMSEGHEGTSLVDEGESFIENDGVRQRAIRPKPSPSIAAGSHSRLRLAQKLLSHLPIALIETKEKREVKGIAFLAGRDS